MKRTDSVVKILRSEIENKNILEVACGRAEFSISASDYAHSVSCIDLDDSKTNIISKDNIYFEIMDAARMRYPDETFDAVFLYNAFAHIHSQWETIEMECMRVLKPEGSVCIIATWKYDIALIQELYSDIAELNGNFLIVRLKRR